MLRLFRNILLFQRRIIPLAVILSFPLGVLFGGRPLHIGYSVLLVSLAIHYWVYEFKNPQDYYFYFNQGLSRLNLWISTLGFALLIILILAFI